MALPLLIGAGVTLAAQILPILVGKIAGERAEDVATKVVEAAAAVTSLPQPSARDLADPQALEQFVGNVLAILGENQMAREQLRFEFEKLNDAEHARILADRASARDYQIATGQGGRWRGNIMLMGVASGLILSVVLVVAPKLFGAGDPATSELSSAELALVTTIAGALLKMLSDAFAFEFGSSRGSKEKDVQIQAFKQALIDLGRDREASTREVLMTQSDAAAQATQSAPPRPDRDFVSELLGERAVAP